MNYIHKTLGIEDIGKANYILKVEKKDIQFKAGQFFSIGTPSLIINREYSVCSGEKENQLEFLIREIDNGILSKQLRNLKINDPVKILGPYGNFYLKNFDMKKNYIFIASGTGISPFMSLIKTNPNLNYKLLHGIRYIEDSIDGLINDKYLRFISREKIDAKNCFYGRITKYLNFLENEDKDSFVFLCGNSLMVTEIYDNLINYNFKSENIFTEIFF